MVLLESGENLKEKQTADIIKKFGETIDLFQNFRKFFDNSKKPIEVSPIESKFICAKLTEI
jgi:hypothetical protein